jgi:hypothetical protein
MNQQKANLEIFRVLIVEKGRDFADWLETFLAGGDAYPFLMGGPQEYDLGDLLRALLPPARIVEQRILETAFQSRLAAAANGFDLEVLRQLAHAAARAGFNTISRDLANAVETVIRKLERAVWSEQEKASAFVATDQVIGALASFALDGDKNALRVARVLFEDDDLAPFASSLFTPLAADDIEKWPDLWCRLVQQAVRPATLFNKELEREMHFQLGGVFAAAGAHFDIIDVLQDLLASSTEKGFHLQEIYDAVHTGKFSPRVMELALAALDELEGRRIILRRPNDDDQDLIFFNPMIPVFSKTLQISRHVWTATVGPKTTRDWRPAQGQMPSQLAA